MMKATGIAVVVVAMFVLGGCAFTPKVTLSTPEQVIIQQQSVAGGPESNLPLADAECKKHDPNKTAVFRTTMLDPIADKSVYDCVKR
jgi:hypothetical protein